MPGVPVLVPVRASPVPSVVACAREFCCKILFVRFSGDVKVVCPLTSGGEHGRKGAFVAFGNTEAFYRNVVEGHGPYRAEGEGGEGEGEGDGGECEGYGGVGMEGERKSKGERGQGTAR